MGTSGYVNINEAFAKYQAFKNDVYFCPSFLKQYSYGGILDLHYK